MRIRDSYSAARRMSVLGLFAVGLTFVLGMAWLVLGMAGRSFTSGDDYEDEIEGLDGKTTLARDANGIPYITAASEDDAMTALGYAHAQDRLWQMDLFRRVAQGRLSELMGSRLIGFDAYMRTIGFSRIAARIYKESPAETRATLTAYCRGVNAFIERSKGHYPFEFDALAYEPEPWEPSDCIIIMRLLAWEQNTSLWTDLAFERLRAHVDSAKYREIVPWYPSYGPTVIPGGQAPEPLLEALRAGIVPKSDTTAADSTDSTNGTDSTAADSTIAAFLEGLAPLADADRGLRNAVGMGGSAVGSNGWVIAPSRTQSKRALLANDPHLQHSAPSKWYQAVIRIGKRTIAGVTVPGMPFIVAGRNDDIAWGLTNLMADESDFYLERLDAKTKEKALHDGRYEAIKVRYDTVQAKDTLGTPIVIRESRHGPLVSDLRDIINRYPPPLIDSAVSTSLVSVPSDTLALALRWLGRDVSFELTALQKLNRARTFNEFKAALAHGGVPGLSLLYADRKGNIGYVPCLRAPVRTNTLTNRVNNGWESLYNWRGLHKVGDLPTLYNPKEGYIASANNKLSNSLPFTIGDLWVDPSRSERLHQFLSTGSSFESIDCIQMQGDMVSPHMAYMVEFLLRAFPDSAQQGKKVREALGLLRRWNGEMSVNSPEASIMAEWMQHVFRRTWRDEMGPGLYTHFMIVEQLPLKNIRRQLMTDSPWFDDITTAARERRDDILRVALGEALDSLHVRFGSWELPQWRFGAMHTITFRHPFTVVEALKNVVDIGPFEVGGAVTTLNNGEWDFNKPYAVELGPSMRQIVDFADTANYIRSVITSGASGQPMSDNYQDQTIIWLFNGYIGLQRKAPPESERLSTIVLMPG